MLRGDSHFESNGEASAKTRREASSDVSAGRPGGGKPSRSARFVLDVARRVTAYALRTAGNPTISVELWNGETVCCGDVAPVGCVVIHDPVTLVRLLFNPGLQFGEAYGDGRLEVRGDLAAVVAAINRGLAQAGKPSRLRALVARLLPRGDSPSAARHDIHRHYDLGNDFYRLWLDRELYYTCAYFPRPEMSLEAAQIAKIDHVCRKIELRPGQTVVEAGCGWGGAALYMARRYGATVQAYNISHEQVVLARRRAAEEGLTDRVTFVEDDWRNIEGRFDAFVSIGMLEHVGPKNYRLLGDVVHRCLKPQGRALLHFIGRNAPQPLDAWTKRHIFPGAYVPAWSETAPVFEPHRFSILDVENLRLHYVLTLKHWLDRFEAAADEVRRMFGERFVRMWRLYLAGSLATFDTGGLQLFQITCAREADNSVPRTRAALYEAGGAAPDFDAVSGGDLESPL